MSESRTAGQGEDVFEASDVEPLLSGYRSLPGIFDEMVDRDGRVRAHWQPLLAMLARMGHQELTRRFAAADRHLHDSGVFYRVYEDASGAERPWPLSHVPLLINRGEWQTLKAGLIQQSRTRWQAAGGVNCRQSGIPAAAGGGCPAGRRASAVLRRRHRALAGRQCCACRCRADRRCHLCIGRPAPGSVRERDARDGVGPDQRRRNPPVRHGAIAR